jgi:predicted nucleic acid-binding protein
MAQTSLKVFIDNSIFMAFIDRADLNHTRAGAIMDFLARQNYRVFTSALVVHQVHSRLSVEISPSIALEFLQAVLESDIQILYPQESELLAVYRFLKNSSDRKEASLSEITNATLMDRNDVPYILTFNTWPPLMGIKVSDLLNLS